MQLDYELRLNIRSIDLKQNSETYGQPLDNIQYQSILKTETLDMALLPLLSKPPENFHPQSAIKANLVQYIGSASVHKAGDTKALATLQAYDTVERKKLQPTDKAAEIMYFVKGNFEGVSDRLKNIYRAFLTEEATNAIPLGRYSYSAEQMRPADPVAYELSSDMLSNIMKKGNHYDVFRWEESPPDAGMETAIIFMETISRIEGLVPAFTELLKNRLTTDGSYKMPPADMAITHSFLERARDQVMLFTVQMQDHPNAKEGTGPGLYMLSPKPSVVADLLKRTPALSKIIKDPWSLSPLALAEGSGMENLKAVPEVERLLKSESAIVSKLETAINRRPLFKADEIKRGLRH